MAENQITKPQNTMATKQEQYMSVLAKQMDLYTNMVTTSMTNVNLECDEYQKICVVNAISMINNVAREKNLNLKDFNQDEITNILLKAAMLRLNASAMPKEMYITVRNKYDKETRKSYPTLEFGVEGNGNDAILRKFGVDVSCVKTPLIIREGDEFTYPYFDGEKMVAPTWKPKSFTKKAIAVCYIVEKTDGSKEYLISEREDVAKNLKAHIANNLLSNDYKDIRADVIAKINNMTFDQLLTDQSLQQYISPAWRQGSSQEEMIIRKMKNNATKKYPKDFSSAFVASSYESTFDDYDQYKKDVVMDVEETPAETVVKEIEEKSQGEPIKTVLTPTPEKVEVEVNKEIEKPKRKSGVEF